MRFVCKSALVFILCSRSFAHGQTRSKIPQPTGIEALFAKAKRGNFEILRATAIAQAALDRENALLNKEPRRMVARAMSNLVAAAIRDKYAEADYLRAEKQWAAKEITVEELGMATLAKFRWRGRFLKANEELAACWFDVRNLYLMAGIEQPDQADLIKASQRLDFELRIAEMLTALANYHHDRAQQREFAKIQELDSDIGRLQLAARAAGLIYRAAKTSGGILKTDLLEDYYIPYRIAEQRLADAERRMARLIGEAE